MTKLTYCICGGGSLAHAVAGVLAANSRHRVNVLTRQPQSWTLKIRVDYLEDRYLLGDLHRVSSDPANVIPEADVVILCVPTFARPEILKQIKPFLSLDAWLGCLPGYGGFIWVARHIVGGRQKLFGFQRVPFVCKKMVYGRRVKIAGIRPQHFVASSPARSVNEITSILNESFNMWAVPMSNFLCVCLSMSNSLFHPARIYSMFGAWSPNNGVTYPDTPFFYADWNDEATEVFAGLDREVQAACRQIPLDMAYVKPILQHYEVAFQEDLTPKIRSIRALADRQVPMIRTSDEYTPDVNSYYFTEDIPYGLIVVKGITLLTGNGTPTIDAIIKWYENISGKEYLKNGVLQGRDAGELPLPQNHGVSSLEELVKLSSE